MTTNHASSRSLLKPRAVRADAALGTTTSRAAGALRRLSPAEFASRAGHRRFPLAAPSWPETVPRPAPEHELGVDYDTDWSRKYPVRLARAMLLDNVTRPLARIIADPLVRGDEYLRTLEAPVIFAANHTSHVDTPLLMSCLPMRFRHRTVVLAAADYFFDRRWKADLFAFSLAAIPIERNKVNRRSAQLATDLVEDGWNLIIYPEGGRSPDGWGQIYRGGAAYLSVRTGRPVVPVHLQGTGHILPKGGKGIRRTRTTVTFGTPLFPDEGEDARRFGVRIESAVATLADETTTDWWTARRRAVKGTTPRLQGPDAAPWRRAWALPGPTSAGSDSDADADGTGWPRRTEWPRRTRARSQ
jgi:1-acyl-sn-glycerol-3-phosphate acyltransferase